MKNRKSTNATVFNREFNMVARRKVLPCRMEKSRRARANQANQERQIYTDTMFLSLLNKSYPTEEITTEFLRKHVMLRAKEFNSLKSKNENLTDHQKKALHKIMVAYDLYKENSLVRF